MSASKTRASRPGEGTGKTAATAPTEAARMPRHHRQRAPRASREFTALRQLVIAAVEDMKARDLREIDVRGRSDVTDLLVIASGTSSRHVRSIAEEVVTRSKAGGWPPLGVEGADEGEWVLVDLGDIVVHVMQPRTREFYGLERLWDVATPGDAPAPAS